jgi:hypothetical protein
MNGQQRFLHNVLGIGIGHSSGNHVFVIAGIMGLA